MKTAYLVLGPESSGTRMLARAFVAAGCFGDGGSGALRGDTKTSGSVNAFAWQLPLHPEVFARSARHAVTNVHGRTPRLCSGICCLG